MAGKKSQSSMTEELLDLMQEERFTKVICGLDECRGISVDNFKASHAEMM